MTPETEGRRYRVEHMLGRGGFGTVYHATMLGSGGFSKSVAVKLLNADVSASDEIAARMRDEARILGCVRHRAIVHVDGLVMLDGRWAVVMEYVDGVDLAALIEREPIPAVPALEIAEEVARALYAAYTSTNSEGNPLRLMHRDIKPPNVRITTQGEVKVLDFGIARADFEDREVHTRSMFFGSSGYIAPERLDQVETPKGDVYSVGVVLYEMLAGERLGNTSAHPVRHAEKVHEALNGLADKGVSDEVIEIIRSALEYEPEDRPEAREFATQCRTASRGLHGPHLVDWAESHVAAAMVNRTASPDNMSGQILSEGATGRTLVPVPSSSAESTMWSDLQDAPPSTDGAMATNTTSRSKKGVVGLLLGGTALMVAVGVGAVLLLVAGVVLYAMWPSSPSEPVVHHVPEVRDVPEVPGDPVAPEVPVAVQADAPPAAPPADTPADPPKDTGRRIRNVVAPVVTPPTTPAEPPVDVVPDEPVAAKLGQVRVQGVPPSSVTLRSAAGTFSPGEVPAGRYSVSVTFDLGAIDGPAVVVEPDGVATLVCDPGFMSCKVR